MAGSSLSPVFVRPAGAGGGALFRAREPASVRPRSGPPRSEPGRSDVCLVPASRLPRWPAWAVALAGAWLGLSALATMVGRAAGYEGTLCGFKALTGLPCPTCGFGRGLVHLGHGAPGAAVAMNPLLFATLVVVVLLLGVRLAWARTLQLSPAARRAVGAALLVALLGNWTYLILAGV